MLLLLVVVVGLVLEVVVGKPVGIVIPVGKENEFAGVVVGRPVGITIPLGREKEFCGFSMTIERRPCGIACTMALIRVATTSIK